MSTLNTIEQRIKQIEQSIAQSLANHNALLGSLAEAKNILAMLSAVAPQTAAVDAAASEVIDVITAGVNAANSQPAATGSA